MARTRIVICMGSSCFSRGNNQNLKVIQDYIAKHNLAADIELTGSRCEGECLHGPNITVNGEMLHDVDPGSIIDVLRDRIPSRSTS